MEIIDAHLHAFEVIKAFGFKGEGRPIGNGKVRYDTGEVIQKFPPYLGDRGVQVESITGFMKQIGISKAVVMQGPNYGYQNQYFSSLMQEYTGTLLFSAMIDPEIHFFDEVLNNLISAQGFKVFKLEMSVIAGLTGAHTRSSGFDSPNIDKLFTDVEQIGGTIALDIGGPEETSYRIDDVCRLAKNHPELKIVMCHLLEPSDRDAEQLSRNLEKLALTNVWFDISSLPTIVDEDSPYPMSKEFIARGLGIVGAGKMMWGSDFPGCLIRYDYGDLLKQLVIDNDKLKSDEKEMILYKNALEAYPF